MRMVWRIGVLSVVAVFGGLLVAGTAQAQSVKTGSVTFSGDSGDYISQGDSYSYSTGNGDGITVSSSSGSTVAISINAYNGDWWTVTFDAPGTQKLTAKTYSAAHRHPFNGTGPGLDLSGEGRGCNELTGSFTVTKAVFGADGYVQAFDATFEQHCEGGDPAARGKVHIANPTAPRATTTQRSTTTKPGTTTKSPNVTKSRPATKPRPTPTAKAPAGAPTAGPSADPAAGGATAGTTEADLTNAQLASALLKDGAVMRRAVIGVGIIALLGLAAAGLLVAGLLRNSRVK
ncbi:hypothetical protein [Asanoa sp. NPDC050611]|uniref:hypothetical protein n=1 Tax=Asanoa sp. NPDC050611 TaxID=3157098 RepID=UPI0033FD6132